MILETANLLYIAKYLIKERNLYGSCQLEIESQSLVESILYLLSTFKKQLLDHTVDETLKVDNGLFRATVLKTFFE